MKLILILMLVSCGRFHVSGGTNNRVETTGVTRHEIVLTIDQKLCEGQADVAVCLEKLTTLLQDFLQTLNKAKEATNEQIP